MQQTIELPSDPFAEPRWWRNRSAQDVELARAVLEKRVHRLSVACGVAALLLIVSISIALRPILGISQAVSLPWWGAAVAASFVAELVAWHKREFAHYYLASLRPLQSHVACQHVLTLVRDYESVRAYRDEVVANGRSVLEVDQECMQQLAQQAAREQDAARLELWRQKADGKVPLDPADELARIEPLTSSPPSGFACR